MVTEIQNSSCRMAHECGKFKRKPGYESQPVRQRMTGVSFCSQIVKQSHEKVDKDGIQCKKSDDVKGQPEQMDFWCGVKYRTEPNKNGSHDRHKKNECTKKSLSCSFASLISVIGWAPSRAVLASHSRSGAGRRQDGSSGQRRHCEHSLQKNSHRLF